MESSDSPSAPLGSTIPVTPSVLTTKYRFLQNPPIKVDLPWRSPRPSIYSQSNDPIVFTLFEDEEISPSSSTPTRLFNSLPTPRSTPFSSVVLKAPPVKRKSKRNLSNVRAGSNVVSGSSKSSGVGGKSENARGKRKLQTIDENVELAPRDESEGEFDSEFEGESDSEEEEPSPQFTNNHQPLVDTSRPQPPPTFDREAKRRVSQTEYIATLSPASILQPPGSTPPKINLTQQQLDDLKLKIRRVFSAIRYCVEGRSLWFDIRGVAYNIVGAFHLLFDGYKLLKLDENEDHINIVWGAEESKDNTRKLNALLDESFENYWTPEGLYLLHSAQTKNQIEKPTTASALARDHFYRVKKEELGGKGKGKEGGREREKSLEPPLVGMTFLEPLDRSDLGGLKPISIGEKRSGVYFTSIDKEFGNHIIECSKAAGAPSKSCQATDLTEPSYSPAPSTTHFAPPVPTPSPSNSKNQISPTTSSSALPTSFVPQEHDRMLSYTGMGNAEKERKQVQKSRDNSGTAKSQCDALKKVYGYDGQKFVGLGSRVILSHQNLEHREAHPSRAYAIGYGDGDWLVEGPHYAEHAVTTVVGALPIDYDPISDNYSNFKRLSKKTINNVFETVTCMMLNPARTIPLEAAALKAGLSLPYIDQKEILNQMLPFCAGPINFGEGMYPDETTTLLLSPDFCSRKAVAMLAAELAKHAPVSYTSVISRNEKEIESRSNLLKDLMTPEIKERLIKFGTDWKNLKIDCLFSKPVKKQLLRIVGEDKIQPTSSAPAANPSISLPLPTPASPVNPLSPSSATASPHTTFYRAAIDLEGQLFAISRDDLINVIVQDYLHAPLEHPNVKLVVNYVPQIIGTSTIPGFKRLLPLFYNSFVEVGVKVELVDDSNGKKEVIFTTWIELEAKGRSVFRGWNNEFPTIESDAAFQIRSKSFSRKVDIVLGIMRERGLELLLAVDVLVEARKQAWWDN